MSRNRALRRPGFSMIELLVVIGLIALMLGLLLPAIQRVRETAAATGCRNNLRQLGLACHHYHDSYHVLPPAFVFVGGRGIPMGWTTLLLPYLEKEALWERSLAAYAAEPVTYRNPPHVGLTTVIPTYACPSDSRLSAPITDDQGYTAAYGSYMGVVRAGNAGAMAVPGVPLNAITDGASQTLLIGERPPPGRLYAGAWYSPALADPSWAYDDYSLGRGPAMDVFYPYPYNAGSCMAPFHFGPGRLDNPCDCNHFWSLHPGGAHFLFADGAVHFLSYSAEPIMIPLATRAGGEAVQLP